MRISFWKASTLAAGFVTGWVFMGPLYGQETRAGSAPAEAKTKATPTPTPKGRTIALKLVLSGVSSKGCKIEVKPANPSCAFKPETFHQTPQTQLGEGATIVTLKDVDIRGADRNCAVAVTIRQEGLPPKTFYRGFRVAANPKPGAVESFETCMSCQTKPSSIATSSAPATRR